ncbi:hypothetical protein G2W53_042823 [Senna tora]|uniref:Uncharacterized protein n=1 Tax=Senna tora TaxID=362788 RepID=A0A834SHK9_9FABA|nr:hypothetical protein G2W53_042823 [Senna tora]
MEEIGKGSEGWSGAISNLTEMSSNLDSLQNLLLKNSVFLEDHTFATAFLTAEQSRTIKVLEQRVETLERELDAAITAAARARSEKRQAEAAQKAAELRAQEVTKELENTTRKYSDCVNMHEANVGPFVKISIENGTLTALPVVKCWLLHWPSLTSKANIILTLIAEVFELHMEELRAKQEEISKRDEDIKLLEAISLTLGGKNSRSGSL